MFSVKNLFFYFTNFKYFLYLVIYKEIPVLFQFLKYLSACNIFVSFSVCYSFFNKLESFLKLVIKLIWLFQIRGKYIDINLIWSKIEEKQVSNL